jgi:putative hydrolase of the HAD superfamily
MTEGLIFDYGGTLDTGGQHWGQALWHAYERHHVPVTEAQFREAYVHAERTLGRNPIIRPDFTFRQTLEKKLQLQLEFLERNVECGVRYAEELADDLYERTVEQTSKNRKVLQALKDRGLPLVLVSNFYGNMSVVLREFGFDGLFLQVIESAVVGIRKPDPRIFLLGVEALGLKPEEVTVVGDSLDKDIIPAQETGCQTVWLRGEGWNPGPHKRDCPHCETIDSLDELLRMIEKKL